MDLPLRPLYRTPDRSTGLGKQVVWGIRIESTVRRVRRTTNSVYPGRRNQETMLWVEIVRRYLERLLCRDGYGGGAEQRDCCYGEKPAFHRPSSAYHDGCTHRTAHKGYEW